jgi:prevent-host-death family protein
MSLKVTEDIRSVTELKRRTREILEQVRRTRRPIVLTVNGKADAVLIDARTYEKHLSASNLSRILLPAERDVLHQRVRPMPAFLREFKNARKVSS